MPVCDFPFVSLSMEEEAIQLDGLNAAKIKEIREKSEKHVFKAEVNRMMKLIINSLYKNKEVCVFSQCLPSNNTAVILLLLSVCLYFVCLFVLSI